MENIELIDEDLREAVIDCFNNEGSIENSFEDYTYMIDGKEYFVIDYYESKNLIDEFLDNRWKEDIDLVPYHLRDYMDYDAWLSDNEIGMIDFLEESGWENPKCIYDKNDILIYTHDEDL